MNEYSMPGANVPTRSASPKIRAGATVTSRSASSGVAAAEEPAWTLRNSAISQNSEVVGDAPTSVHRLCGMPAARTVSSGITPEPSRVFDTGQWAIDEPDAATMSNSSLRIWMQWARIGSHSRRPSRR